MDAIIYHPSSDSVRYYTLYCALSSAEASKERDRENRALRSLIILFTSPPIYLLLSLALQPAPLEKFQGTSAEERVTAPEIDQLVDVIILSLMWEPFSQRH